jgi:uncharacterized protein
MKNKPYSVILWVLFLLFCFRVSAQLTQYFFSVSFLPPFESWHSGTLSYPILVGFQVLIIALFITTCIRITNGSINLNYYKGKKLFSLGLIYAFLMVARYILRMSIFPAERWFGGAIPIFFHIVLASFIITAGRFHVRNAFKEKNLPNKIGRIAWSTFLTLIFSLIPIWLIYQLLPTFLASKLDMRDAQYSVVIEKNVKVETEDKILLRADIYKPESIKTAPTILIRIPLDDNLKGKMMSNVLGRLWAERGYNVVVQGVRGRFGSTGKHIPFTTEREDGIATLKWLNKQSWHNGKVGMWGGSYFGYTQWVLYDQDELGLKALFTHISSSSNHDMFYPGGVFSYKSGLFWATRSHSSIDTPHTTEELKEAFSKHPMIEGDDRVVGDIPFFNDWVRHTSKNDFWRKVDGENRASSLKAPILSMAGWYDPFLSSQIKDWEDLMKHGDRKIAQESRLIIGPWAHAETVKMPNGYEDQNYRLASIAPAISWYDKHLKGLKTKKEPQVRLFVMGVNEWRDEDEFPLKRTMYVPLNLADHCSFSKEGKVLTMQKPQVNAVQTYISNPENPVPSIGGAVLGDNAGPEKQNDIEKRKDVLVYSSTGLIMEELEITGKVKLVLYVSSSAKSTDFIARLIDVYPNGNAYNISEGIKRVSFETKAQIKQIEIDLTPTSNVFLKGHHIQLEIMSSCYPRYSLNFNTGGVIYKETKGIKAEQKVYTGNTYPSQLVLPFIPPTTNKK